MQPTWSGARALAVRSIPSRRQLRAEVDFVLGALGCLGVGTTVDSLIAVESEAKLARRAGLHGTEQRSEYEIAADE